ncbi:MAG TPA: N-acetylneuraminate synthase family protein [Tepidisphaeraceae bacterium]|jgi:N-acetylneuraminate synthase|nr:N-acetylneuraminate synthase family protein [Tepidisphaeraceae bacterium]
MSQTIQIGNRLVGHDQSVYVIAEIGINHNGDLNVAKKLIETAKLAGCDAVKFQKRTPELCVPPEQRDLKRETPWGVMTYLNYRHRVEFGEEQYGEINRYCREIGIDWFASCWDEPSVDFIERFNPVCYKIASASLTDESLLRKLVATGKPLILSTGMSTMEEIRAAVSLIPNSQLVLCHATSTYPCKPEELNLRMINTLQREFDVPVGYSGHETGLATTLAAVGVGACFVERHITLDRAMWGSDQAASVEPVGLVRLVRDIRATERALGDGVKKVYDSEKSSRAKLRRTAVAPEVVTNHALLEANRALRNCHAGERCFIVATGPSIKQQPLHLLKGEQVIGVSNLFVHKDCNTIKPAYWCVAPYHAPITEDGWQTWLGEMAAGTAGATMFFGLADRERNERGGHFDDRAKHYLGLGTGLWDTMAAHGVDLTRPLQSPQGVTIMALYAALYMGFSEIHLLGCDHDWILHLNQSTHFYDEKEHALNRGGYNEWFNGGIDEYFKDYQVLWRQYRMVKQLADERGVRILNATAGGLLDVFPRVKFESLFDRSLADAA